MILTTITLNVFAQTYNTYTIDYSTLSSLPNASSCNIFSIPTTINGYVHKSVLGFPKYYHYTDQFGNDNKVLQLDGKHLNGVNYGTEYEISFPFKLNRNYTISALASASGSFFDTWMGVNSGSNSFNTSTNCTGPLIFNPPPIPSYPHVVLRIYQKLKCTII